MHYKRYLNLTLRIACSWMLSACTSGYNGELAATDTQAPAGPPISASLDVKPSERGQVISATSVGIVSKSAIINAVNDAEKPLVGSLPQCSVSLIKLVYATIDPFNRIVPASAGILIPNASNGQCTGPYPMVSSQHGTNVFRGFSQTSINDGAVLNAAAYFAAQGYVTVLPDYLGYGSSTLDYHPYLQAESSAAAVIDAIRAARTVLKSKNIALNGKLFLSGTSEGGYVTMATQMVIERDFANDLPLTAVMAASGPYDTTSTMDTFISQPDNPEVSTTIHATMTLTALNKTYMNIYASPTTVFNAPWSNTIEGLIPGSHTETELFTQCLLPYNLKDGGGRGFGSCSTTPLLQDSFVQSYKNKTTDPNDPAYQARVDVEKQNLLKNWTPKAPLALYYGSPDSMASPNALAAQSYFLSRGFQALTVEDVQAEQSEPIHTWIVTQGAKFTDGAGYHGKVEAPACVSWGKHQFFDRYAF